MMKSKNKIKKHVKSKIFSGINLLIIVSISLMGAGCTDNEMKDITGTYSKDNKTTLEIYDNNSFFFIERQGYLLGREIKLTTRGTYRREDDMIIFSGDGVTTTAYIQGENLIIEGSQYSKIKR